ncbi:MAG TPA: hypothetical protein VJT67_03265 [Longimicrobiaceae bacterium]|nr:hypothetical protein [Longimicrobiaceae bacterium]
MILHCNFEELRALAAASEAIVAGGYADAPVAPQPDGVVMVEELLPRLTGDVSIETLPDQRRVQRAVRFIVGDLHRRLDERLIETHPADEEAVALYFDYGYTRTVLHRLDQMGAEMEAIVDLIGGNAAAAVFPD